MNSVMKRRIKQTTKVTYKKRFFVFAVLFAIAFCCALVFGIIAIKFHGSLNDKTQTVAALNNSIKQYNEEIEKLNNQIAELNRQNSDSSQLSSELQSTVDKYKSEIDGFNKEIERLNSELDKMGQITTTRTTTVTTTAATTPPPKPEPKPEGGKVAYLTFDDGPSLNTPKILNILKEKNAVATFFVINSKHNEYIPEIVKSGNAIGLHTYSHSYSSIYSSEQAYFDDLNAVSNLVKELSGVESKVIRFPGGSSNTVSAKYSPGLMTKLADEVGKRGYAYFDWNVDSSDASARTAPAQKIIDSVLGGTKNMKRICVLMHDSGEKTTTVDALPYIIDGLRSQGYTLEVLTESTEPFHHGIRN